MQANNSITGRGKVGFSTVINAPSTRAMIDKSISDPSAAAAFVSTLISVVNATPKLKDCDAGSIISAGLRGEIAMGLSVALGEYSIVPYGNRAQFQIGANGLKRMCIRSKQYSAIGFFDVREGEMVGRDARTRTPIIQWKEDEARENLPIVGYYGFYQLNEENNNFFQCIYWTREKVLRHADRYSKAFSYEKYQKLLNGELSVEEVAKLQSGSPWYGLPTSEAHTKMCLKTIAKQLLNDGLAPKEVRSAINVDNAEETSGEPVIYKDGETASTISAAVENIDVDADGVISETTNTIIDAEVIETTSDNVPDTVIAEEPPKAKRGRPRKVVENNEPTPVAEAVEPVKVQDSIIDDFFN